MDSLPTEVIAKIFSRLPTLDLGKLRYVCKRWRNILKNPIFRSLHCARAMSRPYENQVFMQRRGTEFRFLELTGETRRRVTKIEMPYVPNIWRYQIIGSCNGLLCLASTHDWSILVMNPLTRHHLLLSMPPPVVRSESGHLFSWGFGFDAVNKLFKVIVIAPGVNSEVKICDLGCSGRTNWRNIGESAFKILNGIPACFINGRLHWTYTSHSSLEIVSFDLTDEVFRLVPRPDFLRDIRSFDLIVLGGCLCMFVSQPSETQKLQIWAMTEYGVEKSWIKKIDVNAHGIPICLKGLGSVNDGKILLQCCGKNFQEVSYFLFDLTCDQFELIELHMPPNRSIIHTVSLNWI